MTWRVWLDDSTALIVAADTADAARLQARLQAWVATGRWVTVSKVEQQEEQ